MATLPPPRSYPLYGLSGTLPERLAQGVAQGTFRGSANALATFIAQDWKRAAWASAVTMAQLAECHKSTLSRFVRQLGYLDYASFQKAAELASSKATNSKGLVIPQDADARTEWFVNEFEELEQSMRSHITHLNKTDFVEFADFADQVKFVAERLFRAKKIYIAGATPAAMQWCPTIHALFSSSLKTEVREISGGEQLRPSEGNHLIILHVDPPPGQENAPLDLVPYDFTQGRIPVVHAVHIVVGRTPPKIDRDDHRILHVHDGRDHLAGIAMMLNICMIMIRDITGFEPMKKKTFI
jgi:hypothetical protein